MADQETAVSRDESFKSEEIKDDTSTKRRGREYFKRKVKDTFGHLKRLRYSKEKNKDKESPSENQPMLGRLIANARRDTEERDAEATQFEDSEGDSGEEFTTRMKGRLEQAHHQSEQVKAQMGTLIANAYSRVSVRAFIGEINTPGALRTQIIALREAEEKGVHDEEGGISAPEALAGRRVLQVVGRTLIANATNEGIRESDGDSALFYDVNLTSRFRTVGDMSRFTDPIKHDCDSLRSEIDDIVLTHSREKASEIRTRYEGILTDTFQDGSLPLALRQSFLEQTLEPQLEAAVVSGQIDRQRKDEIIAIVQGISDENSVERAALLSPFMPMYRRSDDAYIDSLDGFIRGEEYFGVQQLVSVACNNELAEIQQGIHKNFSRAARDTRHNEQDIIRIFSIDGIAMTPDMADDTIDIAEKFPGITQTTFRFPREGHIENSQRNLWREIRASTKLRDVFAKEITDIDGYNRSVLLSRSLKEDSYSLIPMLADYSTDPVVVKALALFDAYGIPDASEIVSDLKTRGDWSSLVDSANEQFPGLNQLLTELGSTNESIRRILENRGMMPYLFQHPESIGEIVTLVGAGQDLSVLIEDGGACYVDQGDLFRDLLENGQGRTDERESSQSSTPEWKRIFTAFEEGLGDTLPEAESEYPIQTIPRIAPVNGEDFTFEEGFDSVADLSIERKRQIADYGDVNDQTLETITEIPFNRLREEYKRYVYAGLIKDILEKSSDEDEKQRADQRNRATVQEHLNLEGGIYIHGSTIQLLPDVLHSGNLSGDIFREGEYGNSSPFHADFSNILDRHLEESRTPGEVIDKTITGASGVGYGTLTEEGTDAQIIYVYDRVNTEWQPGIRYFINNDTVTQEHAQILAGIPATETSSIILRNPDVTLEDAKNNIVKNGFYIPLYNRDGQLLFRPEEYDLMAADLNK